MKTISFGVLTFTVLENGNIALTKCYSVDNSANLDAKKDLLFFELDLAGGTSTGTYRMSSSEESGKLKYESHEVCGDVLSIVQMSDRVRATSVFTRYNGTNAVRVLHKIENISADKICLEMTNTFKLHFGKDFASDKQNYYFHTFRNARYTESMPDVRSFHDCGLQWKNGVIREFNVGNASACRSLPQGIVENRAESTFFMFQIESYTDWVYQISSARNRFNLQFGGPVALHHDWNKVLQPGESYETVPVAIAGGHSLNDVLAQMTKYRRYIKPQCAAEKNLPAIYNEYMHYSWDDPNAQRVHDTAPYVAAAGCKYYVVDCGWHDPKDITRPLGMYPKFGTWYEDKSRFPDGIRATTEYVRSLGMKFGLWIGPEVVGVENEKMLAYYDDDCFFRRNGEKIRHATGYLLDFRHPKVYDYMSKALDRMIDDYGCDYIKFDGCPNPGFGTEVDATSLGDGLEKAYEAFLKWVEDAMARHPHVIFEDCAGGGMRIDYKALSIFHLVSTSDQTDYLDYPYISANISVSVLPEQAAVWSYPVGTDIYDTVAEEKVNENISKERVVVNMVNALLGRIHLASRIQLLDDEKRALIREGVDVYDKMTADKLASVPYLPQGYAQYGDTFVASGLKCDGKVYLAVWNLGGERHVKLELPEICVKDAKVIYPVSMETKFAFDASSLTIDFTEDIQARLFELTIE